MCTGNGAPSCLHRLRFGIAGSGTMCCWRASSEKYSYPANTIPHSGCTCEKLYRFVYRYLILPIFSLTLTITNTGIAKEKSALYTDQLLEILDTAAIRSQLNKTCPQLLQVSAQQLMTRIVDELKVSELVLQ